MQPWDGLPLNTPTVVQIIGDRQTVACRTSDPEIGGTGWVQYPPVPGSAEANRQAIFAAIRDALAQLRTIQTQVVAFTGQADYVTANLANLNDLLHKAQLIATGVGILATDLLGLARLVTGQFDGTT